MRARSSSTSKRPPSSRPTAPPSSTRAHFASSLDRAPPPPLRPISLPFPSPSLSPSSKALLLEDLNLQLNGLLLQSVEKEEVAEDARDELLAAVRDEGEQRRLERIFGVERGKAWQRLQAMKREHQLEVARKMQQLGIIEDDDDGQRAGDVGRQDEEEWDEKSQLRSSRSHRSQRVGGGRQSALR